jgi:hypothetical protein
MCNFDGTDGTDGTLSLGFDRMRARARAHVHACARARPRTRCYGYPPIYPSHPSPRVQGLVPSGFSVGRIVFCICPLSVPSVPARSGRGGEA